MKQPTWLLICAIFIANCSFFSVIQINALNEPITFFADGATIFCRSSSSARATGDLPIEEETQFQYSTKGSPYYSCRVELRKTEQSDDAAKVVCVPFQQAMKANPNKPGQGMIIIPKGYTYQYETWIKSNSVKQRGLCFITNNNEAVNKVFDTLGEKRTASLDTLKANLDAKIETE